MRKARKIRRIPTFPSVRHRFSKQPETWRFLPETAGKSLFSIKNLAKIPFYAKLTLSSKHKTTRGFVMKKELASALNDQMVFELYSSYIYLGLAACLEKMKLPGAAHWMRIQVDEEIIHAAIISTTRAKISSLTQSKNRNWARSKLRLTHSRKRSNMRNWSQPESTSSWNSP